MVRKYKKGLSPFRRNFIKTDMDKYNKPKVYRKRKRILEDKEILKELREFYI